MSDSPSYPTEAAQGAATFVQGLGVNVHVGWADSPYTNLPQLEASASYLGVHNLRDVLSGLSAGGLDPLAASGFRLDLIATSNLNGFLTQADALARLYPGAIAALEGPNEVDSAFVPFNGLTGFPAAAAFQAALYASARADPLLSTIPIYNLTVSGVDAAKYQALGDLSPYADDANVHIYYGGGQPSYGWNPADPRFSWSNYLAAGQIDALGKPTVITETGATTSAGGVSETVQAKQILNALMDAARTGVASTYLYELADSSADPTGSNPEAHYGLFHNDWSPKLAATAVHNLTGILTDEAGPITDAASLAYAISGLPATGAHQLFEEQTGVYDVVLWAEPDIWDETRRTEVPAPGQTVTVSFPTTYSLIKVYDPLVSRDPILTVSSASSVTVSVVDHPLVVEIDAATPVATPGPLAPTAPVDMNYASLFLPGFALW